MARSFLRLENFPFPGGGERENTISFESNGVSEEGRVDVLFSIAQSRVRKVQLREYRGGKYVTLTESFRIVGREEISEQLTRGGVGEG